MPRKTELLKRLIRVLEGLCAQDAPYNDGEFGPGDGDRPASTCLQMSDQAARAARLTGNKTARASYSEAERKFREASQAFKASRTSAQASAAEVLQRTAERLLRDGEREDR